MGIQGPNVIAMVNFNHIPVTRMVLLIDSNPGRCGDDRRTAVGLKIKPTMKRRLPSDRVDAPAKR